MISPTSGAPKRKIALVLTMLATAGLASGAVAGMAAANEPPAPADYSLKALHASSAEEALPYQIAEGESSVQKDTLRLLANHEGAQYWAGLDEENNLCLVALLGSVEWISGQSCTTPEVFAAHGAGLRLYGPEGLVEAYLVPDGVAVDGIARQVSTNLYIADPYASASERTGSYKRTADGTSERFALAVFDEPFTLEDPK